MGFLKNLLNFRFSGRADRGEYWSFQICCMATCGVLVYVDVWVGVGLLAGTAIQSMAVTVRRLHDTGLSGWWILLGMIPYVGPIIVLILCLRGSQASSNNYWFGPQGKWAKLVAPGGDLRINGAKEVQPRQDSHYKTRCNHW